MLLLGQGRLLRRRRRLITTQDERVAKINRLNDLILRPSYYPPIDYLFGQFIKRIYFMLSRSPFHNHRVIPFNHPPFARPNHNSSAPLATEGHLN